MFTCFFNLAKFIDKYLIYLCKVNDLSRVSVQDIQVSLKIIINKKIYETSKWICSITLKVAMLIDNSQHCFSLVFDKFNSKILNCFKFLNPCAIAVSFLIMTPSKLSFKEMSYLLLFMFLHMNLICRILNSLKSRSISLKSLTFIIGKLE